MDVNVLQQRCRVLKTASPDIDTGGRSICTWESLGFTAGDIITYRQLGEGDRRFKYGLGHVAEHGCGAFIYHGEVEVLKA